MKDWLPAAIVTGLLGVVMFLFRAWRNEALGKVEKMNEKLADDYLSKNEHNQLCQIASLTVKQHFSQELTMLKDAIFSELRKTQELIKSGNGKK